MDWVGARRWWRGGGGGDGELIVSPSPSQTGTQPFAVGVRCAVDQRAVVSVSLLTDTESLRASGFWGASPRALWAPHLPSAGMPGSDPGSIGWGVSGQAWESDRDPVSSALNRLLSGSL